MNVIVIPDGAMIIIPLIEKNGHTYLSPTNFSKDNNRDICDGEFNLTNFNNKYITSEVPSGVKSRIFLFSSVLEKADACIIIDKSQKPQNRMYDILNELILFGTASCNNAHILTLKIVKDLNIPKLYLQYPKNQNELIEIINQTNEFLRGLDDVS